MTDQYTEPTPADDREPALPSGITRATYHSNAYTITDKLGKFMFYTSDARAIAAHDDWAQRKAMREAAFVEASKLKPWSSSAYDYLINAGWDQKQASDISHAIGAAQVKP